MMTILKKLFVVASLALGASMYASQTLAPEAPDVMVKRITQEVISTEVYDVNVLGAWLIETYKENFSAEIGRSGIDGLIRTLSERNRKLAAQVHGAERAS